MANRSNRQWFVARRMLWMVLSGLWPLGAMAQEVSPPQVPASVANTPSNAAPTPGAAQTPPANFIAMLSYVYLHNPQLNAERKNVEVADEKVSQVISGYRPNIGINAAAGQQREKVGDEGWQYGAATSLGLTATQPIFNGFGTLAQRRAADQRVLAERARLLAVEQNILLLAISAWLDIAEKEQILSITQDNVHHMGEYHDAAQTRFKAGDGTQTDIAQSESRMAQAQARLAQAQADRDQARAAFERVTGVAAPAAELPPLPDGLPKSAEETQTMAQNNPELMQTAYQEKAAEQDITAAESNLWPNVFLRASMSEEHSPALGLDRLRDDSLTVNVSIPLYQGGGEYSRVREAKLLHDKSRYDAVDTVWAVRERAQYSWTNYQAMQTVLDATSHASTASANALAGIQEEQRQGVRSLTEVLDEQLQWLGTQIAQTQAQKNLRLEAYRLLAATGQLTAEHLNLDGVRYDPTQHYDDVTPRWVGF